MIDSPLSPRHVLVGEELVLQFPLDLDQVAFLVGVVPQRPRHLLVRHHTAVPLLLTPQPGNLLLVTTEKHCELDFRHYPLE